jgi:sugar lactone lactonase YvrE
MIKYLATPASTDTYVLAEGPVWDAARERVLWVDINGRQVLTGHLQGAEIIEDQRLSFSETIGAVVCSAVGELLVAGSRGLFSVPPDAVHAEGTVATVPGPTLIPPGKNSRLNDGGCDPAGRFLVGSIALDDRQDDEQLLRVEDTGQITVIDDHLGLSNGLAWSPDGTWFYSIDTTQRLIWIRSYDSASGHYGERREFLKITDGNPDGMCVDAEGNLWVAVWGACAVRCFSPDAEHLATVEVSAPNTSSVAFVGPDLDTLLITTASEQLSQAQLDQYPDSGKLFTATVGATGLPVPYWSGTSAHR